MDSGLYAACAGLVARTQALDTIASNVANSSSSGFRGEQNVFGTVLASAQHHRLSSVNKMVNSYGVLSGSQLDETAGTMTRTGNDLDLAIEGNAYFKVQTKTGVAYTRNGAFQVSTTGTLTTATGDTVVGESGPIQLPSGKVAVSPDGTISVDGALAGKLKLIAFAPGTRPSSHGTGYYVAPASAEQPMINAAVRQGSLESSNVSPVEGMVQLISAQRAAESMRHVLSMIDSEMDKTAATDLARVS